MNKKQKVPGNMFRRGHDRRFSDDNGRMISFAYDRLPSSPFEGSSRQVCGTCRKPLTGQIIENPRWAAAIPLSPSVIPRLILRVHRRDFRSIRFRGPFLPVIPCLLWQCTVSGTRAAGVCIGSGAARNPLSPTSRLFFNSIE